MLTEATPSCRNEWSWDKRLLQIKPEENVRCLTKKLCSNIDVVAKELKYENKTLECSSEMCKKKKIERDLKPYWNTTSWTLKV